jgi:hypothetical protein
MAAAEIMTEAHGVSGLQHGYVHTTKAAPIPDPLSMSRTLPRSAPASNTIDNIETSPASSKSKQSTQLSTSDASQFTTAAQKEWTSPSTAFSSQEELQVSDAEGAPNTNTLAFQNGIPQEIAPTRASTGSPTKADASCDVITERKRTASGQSKRASISSIHDLKAESSPGRSRTSTLLSTTSNGSVMEVCLVSNRSKNLKD